MTEIEFKVCKGKVQKIDGEEYFDANMVYLICKKTLEDPEATEEVKKRAKGFMDFLFKNGHVKLEPIA